jgi:N-acetylglutamate synthase-like GNAT family acetyltransferase
MIRNATKFDMPRIIEMLWDYHDSGNLSLDVKSDETAVRIFTYIHAGGGIALVNDKDGLLTGMILAVKVPELWDNTKYVMNEVCLWVDPKHRNIMTAGRLLKKYVEVCDELKDDGSIVHYTISQMAGSDLNYQKFGFKQIETTWSQ